MKIVVLGIIHGKELNCGTLHKSILNHLKWKVHYHNSVNTRLAKVTVGCLPKIQFLTFSEYFEGKNAFLVKNQLIFYYKIKNINKFEKLCSVSSLIMKKKIIWNSAQNRRMRGTDSEWTRELWGKRFKVSKSVVKRL